MSRETAAHIVSIILLRPPHISDASITPAPPIQPKWTRLLDGAELSPDGAYEDGVSGGELAARDDRPPELSESAILETPLLILDPRPEMLELRLER
jgi:hypothetical protein